jgi:hypothetical protein
MTRIDEPNNLVGQVSVLKNQEAFGQNGSSLCKAVREKLDVRNLGSVRIGYDMTAAAPATGKRSLFAQAGVIRMLSGRLPEGRGKERAPLMLDATN